MSTHKELNAKNFDVDFARTQFPAFMHPETAQWGFFENAGGAYAAQAVVDKLQHFMTATKMQPYGPSGPSHEAGVAMDRSHTLLAAAINASPAELMFGPSTSMNTYVLAQAIRSCLNPGDEIIVSQQDHEANYGAWARLAEASNEIVLRQWQIDPDSGLLKHAQLDELLSARTRLVCVTHASNLVGSINNIREIADKVHAAGGWLAVDGVAYAPHLAVDVKQLDVDFYYFSLYKTFGPHQGLMYVKQEVLEQLPNQGHFFNATYPEKKLTPAGPQHGEIACASGIVDYQLKLYHHHFDTDPQASLSIHQKVTAAMHVGHAYEQLIAQRILDFLKTKPVRIIGADHAQFGERAPTIAFLPQRIQPEALVAKLGAHKIAAGANHFYAYRLVEALGIDPQLGVVRVSALHYNTMAEVDRLLQCLDDCL